MLRSFAQGYAAVKGSVPGCTPRLPSLSACCLTPSGLPEPKGCSSARPEQVWGHCFRGQVRAARSSWSPERHTGTPEPPRCTGCQLDGTDELGPSQGFPMISSLGVWSQAGLPLHLSLDQLVSRSINLYTLAFFSTKRDHNSNPTGLSWVVGEGHRITRAQHQVCAE